MTETLAELLKDRLADLPFADRVVGLARVYPLQVSNGEDDAGRTAFRTVNLPVPVSFTAEECEKDPRYLVPDSRTASTMFFEDLGTMPQVIGGGVTGFRSTLRLIGWLNPAHFAAPITDTQLLAVLDQALPRRAKQLGPFIDFSLSYTTLPGDATLLARYNLEGPLLYPPYRLFGLELTCIYRYHPGCSIDFPERITPPSC